MGIDSTLAYLLGSTAQRFGMGGTLGTLGVQDIRTTPEHLNAVLDAAGLRTGSDLYRRLGFAAVESLDISDFEGCTHVVDLNAPGVPAPLCGRYDAVYNGGTLEHVFDVRSALRNVFELLKVGGVAVHVVPSSGWVDHGFYQFSPTLLCDYYRANRFDILEAVMLQPDGPDGYVVHTYLPGTPGGANIDDFTGRWLSYFTVRKRRESTWDVVPRQSYYASIQLGSAAPALDVVYRPPFRLSNGLRVPFDRPQHALPPARRGEGFEWIVRVPHLQAVADGMHGSTSPLVLFEDGEPIGPAHAQHAAIRESGRGQYSHWHEAIHFAPSRNDDARDHVYTYAIQELPSADDAAVPKRVSVNRLVRWSV